ncbi:MAG: hypothetical protein UY63_C0016G0023 [Parcubacteria group bacterium GW2011_GWA2_51_10]|nr:MAG: hypothetical protein UY63_C0016G0023 [Parcubacteria group bacterium GW2011_GWA2_51_10]
MSDEITLDGEQYISSKRASELSRYTQDYVGQLARGGQIQARRVGGLWYIARASLEAHKEKADSYKPVPPATQQSVQQDSLLSFDGKSYVSASYAAKLTGYAPDYVGQLARAGTILSRQVGNRWYVERQAILSHKERKDALLGAVQAEATGLKRENPKDKVLDELRYGSTEPFFRYTSDERDLVPALNNEAHDDEQEALEYAIPIRIVHPEIVSMRGRGDKQIEQESSVVRTSGMAMNYLAIPAIALTIVVVLSIGFVSLKSYSQYAGGSQVIGSRGQAAAAGLAGTLRAYITTAGDFLEIYLTKELVYRRPSQDQ